MNNYEKQLFAEITALRALVSALLASDTLQLSNKDKETAKQKAKALGDSIKNTIIEANKSREDTTYGEMIVSEMDKIIDGAVNCINNSQVM